LSILIPGDERKLSETPSSSSLVKTTRAFAARIFASNSAANSESFRRSRSISFRFSTGNSIPARRKSRSVSLNKFSSSPLKFGFFAANALMALKTSSR
jgi:hypothetical protein